MSNNLDMQALGEKIERSSQFIEEINSELNKVIVGQRYMIDRLLIGLLADGHVLLEGVPGLAKTLTVSSLAKVINTKFQRIQFTPDLLPADLIGTLIYNQKEAEFTVKKGPIFSNIILADEINRSPAKVQSALLEAAKLHLNWNSLSWYLPPKTRSNRKEPILCPKPRLTVLC